MDLTEENPSPEKLNPRTPPLDAMLTYEECAAYLGLSQRTLQRLVRLKRIPHIKIGNSIRFVPRQIMSAKTKH